MIDIRAIHNANHGQYERASYAADTVSNDYLRHRGAYASKQRAWNEQVKNASVKAPATSGSPSAPAKPAPSKDGRRFTSAAPGQSGPNSFGRQAGSYSKTPTPGGVDLGGFDRPKIFAGKGTAQPSVRSADVPTAGRNMDAQREGRMNAVRSAATQATTHSDWRQLPAVQQRSPGAGGPQPRVGEEVGHQEQLFHAPFTPTPRPAAAPAAPEGWAARTGSSMVARSIDIASSRAANRPVPASPTPAPKPAAPSTGTARPATTPTEGWAGRAGNALINKSSEIEAKRASFKTGASSHTNGNGQTRLF
jgi:hypothetical protein